MDLNTILNDFINQEYWSMTATIRGTKQINYRVVNYSVSAIIE